MTGTYEARPSNGATDRVETVSDADLFAAGRAAGIAETEHITRSAFTFLRTRTDGDGREHHPHIAGAHRGVEDEMTREDVIEKAARAISEADENPPGHRP